MQRLNPYWFYKVGVYLGALGEQPKGVTQTSIMNLALHAMAALRTIRDVPDVPLPTCRKPAADLHDELDELFRLTGKDFEISESALKLIASKIAHLSSLISADVAHLDTFWVQHIGIFDTRKLLEAADELLSESVRANLSNNQTLDIREAGACLAFRQATAAGFHSIRAVEDVARSYHQRLTRVADRTAKTLGPLTEDLRREHDKEPDVHKRDERLGLVITFLRRINNIYRKPLTHPEMVLDDDQALNVFHTACNAIEEMMSDLARRGP